MLCFGKGVYYGLLLFFSWWSYYFFSFYVTDLMGVKGGVGSGVWLEDFVFCVSINDNTSRVFGQVLGHGW